MGYESLGYALTAVIPTIDVGGPSLTGGPFPRSHCFMRAHRMAQTTFVTLDKLASVRSHWNRVYLHFDRAHSQF